MNFERLGDKVMQVRGISYSPKDISEIPLSDYVPILKANNIKERGIDTTDLIYIHRSRVKPEQFIRKGDLLLAASSGSKDIVGKNIFFEEDFEGSFGAFCKVVRPNEKISPNFLAVFFKTPNFKRHIRGLINGALINNLKNEHIDSLQIPVLSFSDQLHIANILSKAENLIVQRKESIRLLDEFLKSTFLEMFGDPVKNEKKWNTERLDKIAKLERGRFSPRPRNDPSYYNGKYPFIQTGDISRSKNRLNSYTQTLNERGIKVSKEFKKGTIIIAIVGATIGATAICEIDVYATDSIIGILANKRFTNEYYLEFTLRFWKPVLLRIAPEAARANINLEIMNKQIIPVPPIDLQNSFAQILEKTETLKTQYQESLQELENLYGSLSQRAFRGELQSGKTSAV